MSSAPPSDNPPNPQPEKQDDQQDTQPSILQTQDAEMDTTPDIPPEESWQDIPEDVMALSTDDILTRIRMIENDIKVWILCFLYYDLPLCCRRL
jgi:26S proteasome regulatory subunit T5